MRPGVGLGWVWLDGRYRALAGCICHVGLMESFLLARGELVARGAQEKQDSVEGNVRARGDRSCLAGRDGAPD